MNQQELNKILEDHKLWLQGKGRQKANLTGADLRDANLRGVNLRRANLTEADLRDANLRDANLRDADLTRANLTGADLRDANLRDADLTRANLTGADLRDANLRDADLTRANLTGVNLTRACIFVYQGSKHTAYFSSRDNMLLIGCEYHPIDYWMEYTTKIGISNNYTEQEIKEYRAFMFMCQNLGEEK